MNTEGQRGDGAEITYVTYAGGNQFRSLAGTGYRGL